MDYSQAFRERNEFVAAIRENRRQIFSFRRGEERVYSHQLEMTIAPSGTSSQWSQLYHIDGGQIRYDFRCFEDYPYLEYRVFVQGNGQAPSEIIDDFLPLDLQGTFPGSYYGELRIREVDLRQWMNRMDVRYWLGTMAIPTDFLERRKAILHRSSGERSLHLGAEDEGRCSESYLPFFQVGWGNNTGLDIGVGWTGSWKADFNVPHDATYWSITSGMRQTHFRVNPGETLEAPGYFIGFRGGMTEEDFTNCHRHFMIAHHAPRDSQGKPILPPISLVSWGGNTDQEMLEVLKVARENALPFEVHWIDAGWMGQDHYCPHYCVEDYPLDYDNWFERVGSMDINHFSHPDGLTPVSNYAKDGGMATLAWFEPERYHRKCQSTMLDQHPEWFLKGDVIDSYLVDLGNPEAREYITQSLVRLMRENHIHHYRQDFNLQPASYWRQADEPERVGVHEMKHIAGLYQLWADLRRLAIPDGFIDNCASGGRRMDYRLADFGFPLCQTDYPTYSAYNFTPLQIANNSLNQVYPLHSTLSWMPDGDLYAALSSINALGVGCKRWCHPVALANGKPDFVQWRLLLKCIAQIREILAVGEYYSLTGNDDGRLDSIEVVQGHDSRNGNGYLLGFRREECSTEAVWPNPRAIEPEATYLLQWPLEPEQHEQEISGKELQAMHWSFSAPRTAKLCFYQRLP